MRNTNTIKNARIMSGLSKQELAKRMKVDIFTIESWENGAGHLSCKNLIELSIVLNTTLNNLLFGENRPALPIHSLSKEQQKVITETYLLMLEERD